MTILRIATPMPRPPPDSSYRASLGVTADSRRFAAEKTLWDYASTITVLAASLIECRDL